MRHPPSRPCPRALRVALAFSGVLWMLLVQLLGGSTALVHAHGGEGGHLHFVSSEVREAEQDDWHRRAHGASQGSDDGGPEAGEGGSDLLLRFPVAPQLSSVASGDEAAAPRETAKLALLRPCFDRFPGAQPARAPEPRARSPVRRHPRESTRLELRI